MAQPPAPVDLASAFTSTDQTTMHGDLPAGFWEEDDSPAPLAAASHEPDLHEEMGDGEDGAVPLFAPADTAGALPRPRSGPVDRSDGATDPRHGASTGSASEPEGERYAQLQALFPGRIIEVSRPRPVTQAAATDGDQHDEANRTGYPAVDGYAADPADETTGDQDEPRYDTAAEAAAEE